MYHRYVNRALFNMICVSSNCLKWITRLGHEICLRKGPAFLIWLLDFIKDEMLHPEREDRADCESILDYFNRFVDQKVYRNWVIDL